MVAEAFDDFCRLCDDPEADADRVEMASIASEGATLALARIPATDGRARAAKAQAAKIVLGDAPTADSVATFVERALAASIARDAIAATNRRNFT